jgi:hypothetical protein
VPFVLIQAIVVTCIIAFPSLVSVEQQVNSKEKIELRIDAPPFGGGQGYAPPDFSRGDKQSADPAPSGFSSGSESKEGEGPQLNFSSPDEKK